MKKTFLRLSGVLLLLLVSLPTYAQLRHIEGFNAVGVKAGTGFGNTFTIGLSHNYYWNKYWSVSTDIDFETGGFGSADYFGFLVSPGVEAAAWQPLSWMYLHLNGHLNLGYDSWKIEQIEATHSSFALGCDLGFNLEMYVSKAVSILVGARQHFIWTPSYREETKPYYFKPLFFASIRYNFN